MNSYIFPGIGMEQFFFKRERFMLLMSTEYISGQYYKKGIDAKRDVSVGIIKSEFCEPFEDDEENYKQGKQCDQINIQCLYTCIKSCDNTSNE